MHRALTFRGVGLFRRYGVGQTPSQELLTLAEDDGWGFLYDPTNPSYRTLGTDATNGDVEVVRQVQDGLELRESFGKQADGSPEDPSLSPYYHKGAIGSWDGMEFHDRDSLGRRLKLPALAAPVSQPYFIIALVKRPSGSGTTKAILDKNTSLRLRSSGTTDYYRASVAPSSTTNYLNFNRDRGRDEQTILVEVLVNGASSKTWINGVEDAAGDIHGTNALDGFTLGASEDATSLFWDGRIGPIGIFEGEPVDAVRKRMENLLLKYSDAEIFDIPEALDLDGLAMYLDGSHPETLRDFSGAVAADGTIYRWADKSGLMNHAIQATSGARPIRKVAEQNGRDVVRFDGVDDLLVLSAPPPAEGTDGITVFIVGKDRRDVSPTANKQFIDWQKNDAAMLVLAFDSGNYRVGGRRQSSDSFQQVTTPGDTDWHIYGGIVDFQNTYIAALVDGVTESDDNSFQDAGSWPTGFDDSGIGARGDGSLVREMDCDIAEIVVYTRTLTTPEREQVEEYLQNKWATPALP